jgi:hypothetical protein
MQAASIGFAFVLALALVPVTAAVAQERPTESARRATAPAPPAPVGKCKTNAALRQQCTIAWNQCVTHMQRKPHICQREWRNCCTKPAGVGPASNGFNGRALSGVRSEVLGQATFDATTVSVSAKH